MKKKLLIYTMLCLTMAFAFLTCGKENEEQTIDPNEKVKASVIATIEGVDEDGKIGWYPGGHIYIMFNDPNFADRTMEQNLLKASADIKKGESTATFSNMIKAYTGTRSIYAMSTAHRLERTSFYILYVTYPSLIYQTGRNLDHLRGANHMWGIQKNFDMGKNGDRLQNVTMKFKPLGTIFRFRVKNTSAVGSKYTVKSVTMKDMSKGSVLWEDGSFRIENDTPIFAHSDGQKKGEKTIIVENAEAVSKDEIFDVCMMVPAIGTKILNNHIFSIKVEVEDEMGSVLHYEKEIKFPREKISEDGGLVAGSRYDFDIAIDDNNLDGYTTIKIDNAGSLSEIVEKSKLIAKAIKNLELIGKIDERDFKFMNKNLPNLSNLDMKNVTIEAYDKSEANMIPEAAFENKISLTNINLPESTKKIGSRSFKGCSGLVCSLTIPSGVISIGAYAFSGCSGLSGDLVIPDNVKTIGQQAFYECKGLDGKLTLPNNQHFDIIEEKTFYKCGFTGDLNIPLIVKSIGASAFYGCSGFSGILDILSEGLLESIGSFAFYNCSGFRGDLALHTLTLIDNSAFAGCTGFSGILFFRSIKEIGESAFTGCNFHKIHFWWFEDKNILYYNKNWDLPEVVISIPQNTKAFFEAKGWTRLEDNHYYE